MIIIRKWNQTIWISFNICTYMDEIVIHRHNCSLSFFISCVTWLESDISIYTFLWIWNCLRTGMILPNGFSFELWSWETVSCLCIFFYLLQRFTICENCFFMWFSIIHKKVSFLTPFWEENIHFEITYTLLLCNLKRKYKERTEGLKSQLKTFLR